MFQTILKLFLWLTLSCCILWGSAILLGPKIISIVAKRSFGDNVNFIDLKVSPKLVVTASRVEYKNTTAAASGRVSGFGRALELRVENLLSNNPSINLSIGPTLFDDLGGVRSQILRASLRDIIRSSLIPFQYEASDLDFIKHFGAQKLVSSGVLDLSNFALSDVLFNGSEIKFRNSFFSHANMFNGQIDELKLNSWPAPEATKASIEFIDLHTSISEIHITQLGFTALGGKNIKEIVIDAENISNHERSLFIDDLWVSVAGADISKGNWDNVQLSLMPLSFSPQKHLVGTEFSGNLVGKINRNASGVLEANVSGNLRDAKIINRGVFTADFSDMEFKSMSTLNSNTLPMKVFSKISITRSQEVDFLAEANVQAEILGQDISRCFRGNCDIRDFEGYYKVSLNDSNLEGDTFCSDVKCSDKKSYTVLETDNTNMFFSNLVASKVFNPIYSALIYQQFKAGIKSGDGHQLKF